MNGHKFVQRQFYQIILCAFCGEFLLNAIGYQCEDCKYTCHKKCYEKVVTKCISKSNQGVRLNYCGDHRFINSRSYRKTKRRLIIAFLIGSSRLPTSVLTGVVTVVRCSPWVAKTRDGAASATSHVTLDVPILSLTSVACQWRRRTSCSKTGGPSTVQRRQLEARVAHNPLSCQHIVSPALLHYHSRIIKCRKSIKGWAKCGSIQRPPNNRMTLSVASLTVLPWVP
jgi:hypothetical protein